MDTSTWTVDDHIAWMRAYAAQSKEMARMVIGWDLDALRVYTGLAETVDWPEVPDRPLRRGQAEAPARPEGTRVMHYGGYAYLVRDK